MRTFSNEELAAECRREAAMRRRVYAHRVAEGKMLASKADEGIAMMDQAAERFQALADADNPMLGGTR
jgi:hypothetical protein